MKDYHKTRGILVGVYIIGTLGILMSLINPSRYGDAGTWFGGLSTSLTLLFAYLQLSDENRQSINTLNEMKKERELAYRPNLFINMNPISIKFDKNIIQSSFSKKLKVINLGVGTAQNIIVRPYIDNNASLYNIVPEAQQYISEKDNKLVYKNRIFDDLFPVLVNGYLLSSESTHIDLPNVYLNVIKDYIFNHSIVELSSLPSFKFEMRYQDLQGITYRKEIILIATVKDNELNKVLLELKPINMNAKKCDWLPDN